MGKRLIFNPKWEIFALPKIKLSSSSTNSCEIKAEITDGVNNSLENLSWFVFPNYGATITPNGSSSATLSFDEDGEYEVYLVGNSNKLGEYFGKEYEYLVVDTSECNNSKFSKGLKGTYYGINTQLENIFQFRNIIYNNSWVTKASFIATKLDYGYGTGSVSQGDNLQKFFLKYDSYSLDKDPDNTTDGGINLKGKIYLEKGIYNFRVHSDDGYQIKIDNISVAEIDYNQSPTTTIHSSFLINESGYHDIDIIWWDQGGQYVFKVELSKDNGNSYKVVNSDILFHKK